MMLRFTTALILFSLLGQAVFAESSSSSSSSSSSNGQSSSSGSSSGSNSGGGGNNSYDLGAANITPGTVTQGTPPKNSDRQTQSKAAAAAARAGAGMQKVMCYKMMSDAQKQSGNDKLLMQMLAQQACQQAQQTEQNADKNDKAAKALSADDIPKQGTLTAGKFQLKPSATDEPIVPPDSGSSSNSGDSTSFDESAALVQPIDPANYTLKTPTSEPTSVPTTVAKEADPPTSPLAPVKPYNTNYDENAQKGSGVAGGGGNGLGLGLGGGLAAAVGGSSAYGSAKTVADGEGKAKGSAEEGGGTGKERGLASIPDAGGAAGGGPGGSASGGSEGEKSGESSPLDAMLAQMMGGGAGGADGGPMAGQDVLVLPDKDPQGGTKLPNIFEFANWRYQKAAFEEGRLKTKAPNVPVLSGEAPRVARATKH